MKKEIIKLVSTRTKLTQIKQTFSYSIDVLLKQAALDVSIYLNLVLSPSLSLSSHPEQQFETTFTRFLGKSVLPKTLPNF